MNELHQLIPGLREAEEREGSQWDAAWLGLNESICGIEVKPYTPRHDLILGWNGLRSPFLGGDWPESGEDLALAIGAFMWVVSPQFGYGRPIKQLLFLRSIRKLPAKELIQGIRNYISDAFADAPASVVVENAHFYSWFTDLCDLFGNEYGWKPREVIDTPMKQVWQLNKSIRSRKKPDGHLFKPSDRIVGAWLAERNAKTERN